MSNRKLVSYIEPGKHTWKLEVERSASGQPDLLITAFDPAGNEVTVVVVDADRVFKPMNDWLEEARAAKLSGIRKGHF